MAFLVLARLWARVDYWMFAVSAPVGKLVVVLLFLRISCDV